MDQLKPIYILAGQLHDTIADRLCDTPCDAYVYQLHDIIAVRLCDAPSDNKVMVSCNGSFFIPPELKAHWLAYSIGRHWLSIVHQPFQTASPLKLQGPLL